jgi:hypothetical protein
MNTIKQVVANLLGDFTADFYITYFIFVMFGIILSLRIQALNRDKLSDSTPIKFSWRFLLQDNLKQWIGSLVFVFLSIRIGADAWGVIPTYVSAVIMGLSFDYSLSFIGKWIEKIQSKTRENIQLLNSATTEYL